MELQSLFLDEISYIICDNLDYYAYMLMHVSKFFNKRIKKYYISRITCIPNRTRYECAMRTRSLVLGEFSIFNFIMQKHLDTTKLAMTYSPDRIKNEYLITGVDLNGNMVTTTHNNNWIKTREILASSVSDMDLNNASAKFGYNITDIIVSVLRNANEFDMDNAAFMIQKSFINMVTCSALNFIRANHQNGEPKYKRQRHLESASDYELFMYGIDMIRYELVAMFDICLSMRLGGSAYTIDPNEDTSVFCHLLEKIMELPYHYHKDPMPIHLHMIRILINYDGALGLRNIIKKSLLTLLRYSNNNISYFLVILRNGFTDRAHVHIIKQIVMNEHKLVDEQLWNIYMS